MSPTPKGLLILMLLFAAILHAAEPPPQGPPQRQALLQVANRSLYYVLLQALMDPDFKRRLSAPEFQMSEHLEMILHQAAVLNWLKAAKIPYEISPDRKGFLFSYADAMNEPVTFLTETLDAPAITFSNDRERFKNLEPGQPERDARTSHAFNTPIEINLARLNTPENNFSYGSAISLLFHEYWRKGGSVGAESVVNELANKLREFAQDRINVFPLKNGTKLHTLSFNRLDDVKWLNGGLFRGRFDFLKFRLDLSRPPKAKNWLQPLNQQGLYVWTEFADQCADQTDAVLASIVRRGLITRDFSNEKYYHFAEQNVYTVNSINVVENASPGEFHLDLVVNQLSVEQVFRIPGVSPNPQQAKAFERYYNTQTPYAVEPMTFQIPVNYSGHLLQIKKVSPHTKSKIFAPGLSAKIVRHEYVGPLLKFQLQLNGSLKDSLLKTRQNLRIDLAEIRVQVGDIGLDLSSTSYDEASRIYSFELSGLNRLPPQDIEISQVHLKTATKVVIDPQFGVPIQLSLFEKMLIPRRPVLSDFVDRPVKKGTRKILAVEALAPQKIQILLDGATLIRDIELHLRFEESTFLFDKVFALNAPTEEIFYRKASQSIERPSVSLPLTFNASQFKQRVMGDQLLIEIEPGASYDFHWIEQADRYVNKQNVVMERYAIDLAHATMQLESVKMIDEDFNAGELKWSEGLRVMVQSKGVDPNLEKLRPLEVSGRIEVRTCRKLFSATKL